MKKTIINIIILIGMTWLISGCAMTNFENNNIAVQGTTNSLTRNIERALNNCEELKGSNIRAGSVPAGIFLTGTVTTEKQKYLASTIANSMINRGIVINRITILKPLVPKKPYAKTKK
ncbi:MAG: BON domain-containing protein [Sulfurovaceae bacterium]|nr:BON domain-containing protein [Sulfurovaceae bacterium]